MAHKIPARYTRATDHDATTIVTGVPGIDGWVWTIHSKHDVRAQGTADTYGLAVTAAEHCWAAMHGARLPVTN